MKESRRRELIDKYGLGRSTLPCPAIHTNTSFMTQRGDEFQGDTYVRKVAEAKARAAGVSTTGKRFMGQLCRDGVTFDPEAWIPESDLKDGIKNKCIENGMSLNDGVKEIVKPRDVPDPDDKPYRLSDKIVKEAVREEIQARAKRGEPVPTKEQRRELASELRKKHSGAYA